MNGLASPAQLRASLIRWIVVCVPLVLLLGFLSGQVSGNGGPWYAMLAKPPLTPPGWVFPIAWGVLYALQGVALALVLSASGSHGREWAVALFSLQLTANLAWSPVFFAWHLVSASVWVLAATLALAVAASVVFGRIRRTAGWLMVPYLAWLCYAGALNLGIDRLNPDGETLVPGTARTHLVR